MFFLCPFELYYLQIHKNVNCLTAVWKKSLKHIVFNLSCSSQTWPKNRLYVPSGTLTSCLSCSLSPYLFFPCLGLPFQRKFNFCSRSTLIIPGLTGLYCLTHTQEKRQGTPWPGHNSVVWRKPRWTPSASPVDSSLGHLECSQLRSQSRPKRRAIVHVQHPGHEQFLYLTHFPPIHKCLSAPLTLYSSK